MTSLTVENYVKTIYQICLVADGGPATTGSVAEALGVSPGAVTSMLKTLGESGLAEYTPYEGVCLTEAGRKLALRVLRRHRLIELFLARTLDLSWDEVHEEAEHMEHAVSDRLVDRSLQQWTVGERFRLVRVLDQSPEFLRYLSASGLQLGAEGQVREHQQEAGVIIVDLVAGSTPLAWDAAAKLIGQAVDE